MKTPEITYLTWEYSATNKFDEYQFSFYLNGVQLTAYVEIETFEVVENIMYDDGLSMDVEFDAFNIIYLLCANDNEELVALTREENTAVRNKIIECIESINGYDYKHSM